MPAHDASVDSVYLCGVSPQRLHLLATISIITCWAAVALAWLAGAIYYEPRAPAEQARARYLSPLWISTIVLIALSAAVPRADWRPLEGVAASPRLTRRPGPGPVRRAGGSWSR